MQKIFKLLPVIALFVVNSCSFANKSTVTVPISSNPPGATIVIDGKNYGQTPAFVELKPSKNYKATISKPGYGSANIDMDTWYSLRDGKGADGGRCMADVGSFVLPYFIVLLFAPEKCGSFKQEDYFVDLAGGKPIMPENNFEYQNNNQNQSPGQSYGQPSGGYNESYYSNQPQYQNNGYQNGQNGYNSSVKHPSY
jgi:hypothetical protein